MVTLVAVETGEGSSRANIGYICDNTDCTGNTCSGKRANVRFVLLQW